MKAKHLILSLAAMALCIRAAAGIVMETPVITDTYMKFVGVNEANNYKYTLDTYEWADRGPQFQITLEPLDASKPAAVTTADLSDPNYWEPLFRQYTLQLAGEAMEAADNVKQLHVKSVSLPAHQFAAYENLHVISIETDGSYSLPDGIFSGCTKMETLECNVQGTLTLGAGIVNAAPVFTVNCSTGQAKQAWTQYKTANNCHYTVTGDDDPNIPAISRVQISLTVNGYTVNLNLPNNGITLDNLQGITEAHLNNFTATTTADFTELVAEYCICLSGTIPTSDMWRTVNAIQSSENEWQANNLGLDLLEALSSDTSYQLYFHFYANVAEGGRATYPTDGNTFRLDFTTGTLTALAPIAAESTAASAWYTLDGRRLPGQPAAKGIYIRDGKKIAIK